MRKEEDQKTGRAYSPRGNLKDNGARNKTAPEWISPQQADPFWVGRDNNPRITFPRRLGERPLLIVSTSDSPMEKDCGDCHKCIKLCPATAIAEDPSKFDHIKCYEPLGQFKKGLNLGHYICGVGVKACLPSVYWGLSNFLKCTKF